MRRLILAFAASAIVASLGGCASSAVQSEGQVQQERIRSCRSFARIAVSLAVRPTSTCASWAMTARR